jgi:EmrB/QacA subfamily drug resistance transporter
MSGIAASAVVVAFDSTIVSTTLPKVAQALDGMAMYAWVGTGYFLASAVSIMIFGRLGDLYGRKPLLLTALAIVILASVLCGASQTMAQLICFRVLQGIGGGMMMATAFAAPADLFPDPRRRVRWMVLISTSFALASGLGPVVGGAVTEALGWRASFFVTPLAALTALYSTWRFFPAIRSTRSSALSLDWLGAAVLIIAVGAPLTGIGRLSAAITSAEQFWALGVIALGLLAVACLIPVERRATTPIFPLRILRSREAKLLNIAGVMAGAVMFILIFYMPLLLQDEFNFSPTYAGLLLTPLVAVMPLGSIINGRLFPRQSEPARLMVFGSVLLGLGCLLTQTFSANSPAWWIVLTMSTCGAGLGFLLPNFTLFMQMLAEQRDVGVASALIQTTRAFGGAVGTALVGIAVAKISVTMGVRFGLVLCVILCGLIGWVCAQIHMKNVPR